MEEHSICGETKTDTRLVLSVVSLINQSINRGDVLGICQRQDIASRFM
jgi:hypothetical protein